LSYSEIPHSKDTQVVVQVSHGHDLFGHVLVEETDVLLLLSLESFAGVRDLAAVEVFDGLFEADGDEPAEDDGGDVDEEVAPGGVALGQAGALASDLRCDRAQAAQ
jgi:hypothetical protein